jgi:transcriptional regulator with XRE-family HTH domain
MQAQDEHDAIEEAARQYAEELTDWRTRRELSKRGLATLMNYDRSYVSQIEGCHLPPTEHFTRRAEAVLDTVAPYGLVGRRMRPRKAAPLGCSLDGRSSGLDSSLRIGSENSP